MRYSHALLVSACCAALAACSSDGSVSTGFDTGTKAAAVLAVPASSGASDTTDSTASTGSTGATGSTGSTGSTGATGSTGSSDTITTASVGPAGPQGSQGAQGALGSLLGSGGMFSTGLGVTGQKGVVVYVLGRDPVGGTIDKVLGNDNDISQLLGQPAGSTATPMVPAAVNAANGKSSDPILNPGLGLIGPNGATTQILGSDVGGALLGTSAPVTASLAGGSNSLLSPALAATNLSMGIGQLLPTDKITTTLNGVPQLGISGKGGLVQDALGTDVVGNLIGTQTGIPRVIDGGENGALGHVLDGLAPVTQPVRTAVSNAVASNPASAVLNAGSPTSAVNAAVGAVQGVTSGVPQLNGAIDKVTGALPAPGTGLPAAGAVANVGVLVTGTVGIVSPTVNNVLKNVTGAVPVQGAPALTDTLKAVTNGSGPGGIPAIGSVLSGLH